LAKAGRPKKEIDQKQFENLCGLQCTLMEFLFFFDCSDKTLDNWCIRTYGKHFSEIFELKRGSGKISLRRSQFQLAQSSAAMAIFLGKNFLGQKDMQEIEISKKTSETIDAVEAYINGNDETNETAD